MIHPPRRRPVLIGLAGALALAAAACTGGTGRTPEYDDMYDPHPGRFESPGRTREAPPTSTDTPPRGPEKAPLGGVEPSPASGGAAERQPQPEREKPIDDTPSPAPTGGGSRPARDGGTTVVVDAG